MCCGFSIVNMLSGIFNWTTPDLESCRQESLPEFAFKTRDNNVLQPVSRLRRDVGSWLDRSERCAGAATNISAWLDESR